MTEPLPRGQQLLLQRIMGAHCVTDQQANQIMESIEEELEASTLEKCLRSINKGLRGFGLEIVTMVGDGGDKFHALINKNACEVAKNSFPHVNAHVRAYIRLLLEALVDGPTVRSTLINLRSDLKEPLKLDLDSADRCIENLLEEHWLVFDSSKNRNDMHAKIKLGPRSFMELSHLLTDLGYPQDELPQFIFHR